MTTEARTGTPYFYALTLTGEERHIFVPLPDTPGVIPPDAKALCGKLLRYTLRQPWLYEIPMCRQCSVRFRPFPDQDKVIERLDAAYCADCDLRMMRGTRHPHSLIDVQVTVTAVAAELQARLAGDSGEEG